MKGYPLRANESCPYWLMTIELPLLANGIDLL